MRNKLVSSLRKKGINQEAVLAALLTVPRHLFFEKAFEEWAYEDKAFPIGFDQTISQPFTVAYQTQLLEINSPRLKVLEVGTGSGYQAAVLGAMGCTVYTIERIEALHKRSSQLLKNLFPNNVKCIFGDGASGAARHAPFDRIIVTAGSVEVPPALLLQLAPGGILVIPVGKGSSKIMTRIIKIDAENYQKQEFDAFRFVPLLKGKIKI